MEELNAIPKFGLYGESSFRPAPGYVHIKDLPHEEFRKGWVIKPHRHDRMFQLVWVSRGQVQVQLDDSHHSLRGAWAITIPPGVVHGFRFMPNVRGVVLTVTESMLRPALSQRSMDSFTQFANTAQLIGFNKDDQLLGELVQYFLTIKVEFNRAYKGHDLMLEWLVKTVLMTLKRQSDHRQILSKPKAGPIQLLSSFKIMVEDKYHQQWTVQQYAAALNTSVSSLNRLCNNSLGVTAKVVIQERLLVEAKRRLIYTGESLEQTAYTLGFKDPAYFSRFFKKLEGTTPSGFRKQNSFGHSFDDRQWSLVAPP